MARESTTEEDRAKINTGPTRREFLTAAAIAGLPLALTPQLTAWAAETSQPSQGEEQSALFFNLSHEVDHQTARYFVMISGRRYRLRPVNERPRLLRRERRRNRFLQAVPDGAVTHFIPNFAAPANTVALGYVIKNPDTTAGTWTMSSIFFQLPSGAVAAAHRRGVAHFGPAALPLSAKRRLYGHPAAVSVEDYLEEQALMDVSDHATALIGLHPEVLSAEPNSAAHIQKNLIQSNGATVALGIQIQQLGDAAPQQTPNQPNTKGWATLRPFTNEDGTQLKNARGTNVGLNQYDPEWHPVIQQTAGAGIRGVAQKVKDDQSLGADVTGALNGEAPPPLTGTIWHRRDGVTNVDQSVAVALRNAGPINYTMVPSTPQNGYNCTADVTTNADGSVHVKLSYENTFLRWLGLWVQFRDSTDMVVPVSKLPPFFQQFGHTDNEVMLGVLTPEFTILGIPVQSSTATAEFDFPTGVASNAKILASGLGSGSHTFQDTEAMGIFCTTIFNLIAPPVLIAAGAAQNIDLWFKFGVIPLIQTALAEIFAAASDNDIGFKNLLNIFVRALARTGAAIFLKIAGTAIGYIAAGEAEDSIPLAGQIIQGLGAAGAGLELIESSIQVANSPWTYEYDLALTHDLTVYIKPDENDDTTPKAANEFAVTALFGNGGTPHVQTIPLPQPLSEVIVKFTDVPLGDVVNVSAAFYQKPSDATSDHVLLGKATSGAVPNTADALDPFGIQEISFPIGPQTTYQHKQKTALDAGGNHVWALAAPPTTKQSDISCEGPGSLCDFRSITVRQGTQQAPGYVGYAYQGYSAGVSDCAAGGQGQLDQVANVNTGEDPQSGYAAASCGLQTGAKLTYNLLGHPTTNNLPGNSTTNFYLDSTSKVIRQVQLDPAPQFADPRGNQAWGKLNLDSTTLLLHPTGRLVSISNANHKMETLKVPSAALSDDDASVQLLARVHAGQGSRPGLMDAPAAAAVSPDGVILVLEQNNNRIQAFDTGANSVQFFKTQQQPYFLNLDATAGGDTVYLDLAVEFTGFLYVLSFNQSTNLYRMDIYHPTQSDTKPISTTQNFNAARLTVDLWRNVYALNYEVLRLPDGSVPPIAEPSVSLWVPTIS